MFHLPGSPDMTDVAVSICTNGKSCQSCEGQSNDVTQGEWVIYHCAQSVEGNQIFIKQNSANHLSFCEIEVRGEQKSGNDVIGKLLFWKVISEN